MGILAAAMQRIVTVIDHAVQSKFICVEDTPIGSLDKSAYSMCMVGVYESFFTALGGDSALQALLAGSAADKKIYPINHVGKGNLPAIRIAVLSGASDVGLPIDRPTVDVLVSSKTSTTELNAISKRVDELINRKRLSGPNGVVVHLCHKVYEADGYDDQSLEYRRIMRYSLIKT